MTAIKREWPPNHAEIVKVFPGARSPSVVFAYAPDIYAPGGTNLPPSLVAHEQAHIDRQILIGVEEWWARYLVDKAFRYDEEVIAHAAEYKHLIENAPNRQQRRAALKFVAKKLTLPLYGSLVTMQKAMADISEEDPFPST